MSAQHPRSPLGSRLQPSTTGFHRRTWVQSILAIATGSLFIALGLIVLRGLLLVGTAGEFTATTFTFLAALQLSLATAGGYITAQIISSPHPPSRLSPKLTQHGLGLAALVSVLCLLSALTGSSPGNWAVHGIALLVALAGISTGTWLRPRQCT